MYCNYCYKWSRLTFVELSIALDANKPILLITLFAPGQFNGSLGKEEQDLTWILAFW